MTSRVLHQGQVTIILNFIGGSIEVGPIEGSLENVLPGIYATLRYKEPLPTGATHVVVKFDGKEMAGEVTFQADNELTFSQKDCW